MTIYLLTWIYGGKATIVKESTFIHLIQKKKSELKKHPNYIKGHFEVRTKEGFLNKPILKPNKI